MNEIKYTSDGKKVVVIGKLNSQETIVQEIFVSVSGDSEIPSGEQFVVKSLHDEPVVSWKEKQIPKIEKEYQSYVDKLDKIKKEFWEKSNLLREKINYAGRALKNLSPASFDTLVNYLTGKITHIIINPDYTPKIVTFDDFKQNYEDKLRLVSIYGKDDGTLTYRINDYTDASGSNSLFIPFSDYDSAFEKFKELLVNHRVGENTIAIAKKYGIELAADKVQEFKKNKLETLSKTIEYNQESIEKNKKAMEDIANL